MSVYILSNVQYFGTEMKPVKTSSRTSKTIFIKGKRQGQIQGQKNEEPQIGKPSDLAQFSVFCHQLVARR